MTRLAVLTALLLAACASTDVSGGGDDGDAADAAPTNPDAAPPEADARPPADFTAVYAHSSTDLYRVDSDTLEVQPVGAFSFAGATQNITDIAIDADGNMVAISLTALYSVNRDTAVTTHLADLTLELTSLSYVPLDPNDPDSDERLIAANWDGTVYEIDLVTGAATAIGDYGTDENGNAIGSSGDIVSVRGFGTVATVTVEGDETDHLAWINPTSFQASLLGDTGVDKIFGIGFWKDAIYGFTDDSRFVLLDPTTGAATPVETGTVRWWGAGVSTNAPVVD